MSEPLLRIRNRHAPVCGEPPILNSDDPELYIGYFENPFGEQWLFTCDRRTGKAELRGGDVGWNTCFEVREGQVADLVLSPVEVAWLRACWYAARGG